MVSQNKTEVPMKRTLMFLFALAVSVSTFAATLMVNYDPGDKRWFYDGDTSFSEPVENPDCDTEVTGVCARLYEFNGTTWIAVTSGDNIRNGQRL